MDKLNHDIITTIINKNIDLFTFINIDSKYLKNDIIFTDKYYSALKRAYKRNSIKYHPDKCINASEIEKADLEYNFNLNQIVYSILSSKENHDEYIECKRLLSIKSHQNLKSSFEDALSNNDIKNLIKESNGGKSYKELAAEKDRLHGIDKTLDSKNVSKLYNNMLSERENVYRDIVKNTKKLDVNNGGSFTETFNELFNGKVDSSANEKNSDSSCMEIQAFNETSNALTTTTFDFQKFNYSDLYVSNTNDYEESFKLLSTNIPSKFEDKLSLDEKIKLYERNTNELANMIMNNSKKP